MGIYGLLATNKVIKNMKILYQRHELIDKVREYYSSKIKTCILVIVGGMILVLIASMTDKNGTITKEGKVARKGYGEGDRTVNIEYKILDEDTDNTIYEGNTDITISEKKYKKEQIEEMASCFWDDFYKIILGKNKSLDMITENMHFVEKIDGYPFVVTYRTDNPLALSRNGKINEENVSDGLRVLVNATINYEEYVEESQFYVCLYKKVPSREERIEELVGITLKESDKQSESLDYFVLPDEVNGKRIVFYKKKNSTWILVALVLAMAAAVYAGKDSDLERKVKVRNEELAKEYSSFINRFVLFYTAGIPVKMIFTIMCLEYEKEIENGWDKSVVYEELKFSMARIKDGEKETYAYEEFANRLGLPQYKTFISLVNQAIQKGRSDLVVALKKETENAFIEKINNSKKQLEEAGTKLLAPMFMMLITVMIMVMFPAFSSFR